MNGDDDPIFAELWRYYPRVRKFFFALGLSREDVTTKTDLMKIWNAHTKT